MKRYQVPALTADEGGLAPPFKNSSEMLETAAEAIQAAGYELGNEVGLASRCGGQSFHHQRRALRSRRRTLSPAQLIDTIGSWTERYPIISIEDGLAEEDWDHWPALRQRLGDRSLTLADDLTCTNSALIQRAIETRAANALLLKVNQIGDQWGRPKKRTFWLGAAGWRVSVSARSGETRRQLARGSGRRLGRRFYQSWIHHPIGTPGQVQPSTPDRTRSFVAFKLGEGRRGLGASYPRRTKRLSA